MGKWKKNIPDGTRDVLFQDCADKRFIEEKLNEVYINRGFLEISTPTLEFYDVFDSENAWIEQEKMYKLFDNQGRIMVLRPDITTPIARIAGSKLRDGYYPLKFCYCENVFRTNEILNGKKNEFTQSGVEIIGSSDLRADIEVIVTAIKALIKLEIKNFKVELGQVEFFKGIIEGLPLQLEDKEKIRLYIENKNYGALRDFLADKSDVLDKASIEILNSLPALFGDITVLDKARELISSSMYSSNKSLEALDNIKNIYDILATMGLSQYVAVDLGMVHNIDYYTGLIFRGYIEDFGDDVLYGGRYDRLISNFGTDASATGFAINVDRILDVLQRQGNGGHININAQYIIHSSYELLGKADILSEEIITKGNKCEMSLFQEENQTLEYARKKKIRYVVVLQVEDEAYLHDLEEDIRIRI